MPIRGARKGCVRVGAPGLGSAGTDALGAWFPCGGPAAKLPESYFGTNQTAAGGRGLGGSFPARRQCADCIGLARTRVARKSGTLVRRPAFQVRMGNLSYHSGGVCKDFE